MTVNSRSAPFVVLLGAFTVMLFYRLGAPPLEPFDDASYADIARTIARTGNWLDLCWLHGIPFLEKPPLYFWITAVLFKVFGESELTARLFPAVSALGVVLCIYVFAEGRSRWRACIAPLLLWTIADFWEYSSRAMLDIPVTLFVSLALALFWKAQEKSQLRHYLFYGVAVGLAILTKGVVGVIPVVVTVLYFLVTAPARVLERGYIAGTALALIVSLPWHLWMWSQYGILFLGEYIGYHVVDRFTGNIAGHVLPPWFYASYLFERQTLFFLCALTGAAFGLYRTMVARDRLALFLLIWSASVFAIFSASQGKLVWYILPMFPPLAVLASYTVERLSEEFNLHYDRWLMMVLIEILLLDAGLAAYRFRLDQMQRMAATYPGNQLRQISEDLRSLTSPEERISIFRLGAAANVISFYAERPIRLLFDSPATAAMYAKMPTRYEQYGVVRYVNDVPALMEWMATHPGLLLMERSVALPQHTSIVMNTQDFHVVRFGH